MPSTVANGTPKSSGPRDRLVAAAEARFRRFGYRRTTVEDITTEARTGKGSLYLHFESKQDIYLAVVAESFERFVEKATDVLRTEDQAPQRLAALVRVTAEHYGEDELLRASLLGDDELVGGKVADLAAQVQRNRIRRLLAEVLEEGKAERTIRSDIDTQATAAVLFEIGWGVVRAELEGHSDLPLSKALATLNDIVRRGITGPAPRSKRSR